MALSLPPGLTPPEVAFLCEMEMVTVVPRQRLEGLELLGVSRTAPAADCGSTQYVPAAASRPDSFPRPRPHPPLTRLATTQGPTQPLHPPHRSSLPLWLALLLKRQRRANVAPPPWLHPSSLAAILDVETTHSREAFSAPPRPPPATAGAGAAPASPPFLRSATADAPPDALPYHWLELGEMLLEAAPDDFEEPDAVRRLMRDLREVRMAKVRAGVEVLGPGGGVKMNGVGGMEIAEGRAFICGVVDGLRWVRSCSGRHCGSGFFFLGS